MEPTQPLPDIEKEKLVKQEQEDALRTIVVATISGYLKNNLDKNNNPLSTHFTEGLKKSIESGIQIKNPNSKDAKVNAFLKYLAQDDRKREKEEDQTEQVGQRQVGRSGASRLQALTHELAEDFAIDIKDTKKLDHLAEAIFQSEIDVAIKRGQAGDIQSQGLDRWDNLDQEQQDKYRHNVEEKRAEQVRSLERWIKYISSPDVEYPTWFKYFVIISLRSVGVEQFELGTYTYGGRDQKTLFRFPTLNPAALSKVYDRMLAAYTEENRKKPAPSKYEIQEAILSNIEDGERLFLEKYAKEANFAQLYAYELSKYKENTLESKRSNEGIWIKYDQQEEGSQELREEAKRLSDSLTDKGTMWCTEGTNFSESQLAGGDFYVYYTREDFEEDTYSTPLDNMTEEEKKRVCTMPRIAIKMYNGEINELRGIVGGQDQALEPEMIDIARARYKGDKEKGEEPLPGGERYEKKAEDMKHLTEIVEKTKKSVPLLREDLLFLYEVDSVIEGFGHESDPRIEEIKSKRNREEDIQTMCNCPPEYIARDFMDITESTKVFCEDRGNRITFFDFREEKNKEKLLYLIELAKNIKETGSPARPDMSFEGGVVPLNPDAALFKDIPTALQVYKDADSNSPSLVWEEWTNAIHTKPTFPIEAIILSYNNNPSIRESSDKIVEDMDKLGYRPATLEEMIALGIIKPEFNKRGDTYLVGLTKYDLVGAVHVPYLNWIVGGRLLGRGRWGLEWDYRRRFVCVRK